MSINLTNKVSFQKSVLDLIERVAGTSNVLTTPQIFLKTFNGDHAKALFLSQILYWCDKTSRDDGWFYKSYSEWEEELFLTPYQIRKYTRDFKSIGLIDTKIKKANGVVTVHYFVRREALKQWIVKNFNNGLLNNFTMESENFSQSLTEITTETTTKTNNKVNKGASFGSSALKFSDYLTQHPEELNNAEIIEAIEYYLNKYEECTGKVHPNLKPSQWQNVSTNILIFDRETKFEDITLEQIEPVIDRHFATKYDNCDYNILHFVSGDIIRNRVYEEGNY
jgi:hypothetical protein